MEFVLRFLNVHKIYRHVQLISDRNDLTYEAKNTCEMANWKGFWDPYCSKRETPN